MTTAAIWTVDLATVLLTYAYAIYPLMLWIVGLSRGGRIRGREGSAEASGSAEDWPLVSISIAAYNEEAQIRELIRSLLAIDYPRDRLQVLITSDGSTDATDAIVSEYADQGIELLRMPERSGKTRAENAATDRLRGEIVVNTDASTRILPGSLKPLIAAMRDPRVGCASGRDVSVSGGARGAAGNAASAVGAGGGPGAGGAAGAANVGEGGYVGYEMAVRDLETRVSGIIGASGCFYAIRADLHRLPLPGTLSRDFAAALKAEEHGFRAVSVSAATCLVPRGASLRKEYRRKVRTIARGMRTLWHKRALLNPLRHPVFAWMLVSHKVCRWALPWAAGAALVALAVLAVSAPGLLWPRVLLALALVVLALGTAGWMLGDRPGLPKVLSAPAFLLAGNVAAAHALVRVLAGGEDAVWEPTRREVVRAG